jgi:hypothetical protein
LPDWRITFDVFYAGRSVAGDPAIDWLGKILAGIEDLAEEGDRLAAILAALNIDGRGDPINRLAIIPPDIEPNNFVYLPQALTRFLPGWSVVFDAFYAGLSAVGDPVF